ncbi:hypothetical protein P10159_3527 [Citrobacter portucalensis]|nr:hypothetical protein P10159_3527 [Citrobacter portucalensis]
MFICEVQAPDFILRLKVKGAMIARIFSCLNGAAWDDITPPTSPSTSPFCATFAPSCDLSLRSHHAVRAAHAHCRITVKSEAICFY